MPDHADITFYCMDKAEADALFDALSEKLGPSMNNFDGRLADKTYRFNGMFVSHSKYPMASKVVLRISNP